MELVKWGEHMIIWWTFCIFVCTFHIIHTWHFPILWIKNTHRVERPKDGASVSFLAFKKEKDSFLLLLCHRTCQIFARNEYRFHIVFLDSAIPDKMNFMIQHLWSCQTVKPFLGTGKTSALQRRIELVILDSHCTVHVFSLEIRIKSRVPKKCMEADSPGSIPFLVADYRTRSLPQVFVICLVDIISRPRVSRD